MGKHAEMCPPCCACIHGTADTHNTIYRIARHMHIHRTAVVKHPQKQPARPAACYKTSRMLLSHLL
jgi:hypothetical protein